MAHNYYDEGCIQIYTGNGKGKTTAAVGITMRAIAAGMRIFFCQFMKNTPTGEEKIFEKFNDQVKMRRFGTSYFITAQPSIADLSLAENAWKECEDAILNSDYDIVVMDELNVAIYFKLIPVEKVLEVLRKKPKQMEIIITGRYAPKELVEIADLVSDVTEIKHYFSKGVQSRVGIEE